MLIEIPAVLDHAKLENIRHILAKTNFIDGKASAGKIAGQVKHNQEIQQDTKQAEYLDHMIMASLAENPIFRSAALPLRVAQPVFSRYGKGMFYGDHVDDPIMGSGMTKFRSDVSVTVFINEPSDYVGGELVIQSSMGEKRVKLAAGDAVLYPSTSLHQVTEVSSGERLVAVTWIQSMVRDSIQRELLYNLDSARNILDEKAPEAEESKKVTCCYMNLLRMWSDV